MVDVIRDLDARHGLGEEHAHWLALRALAIQAHFLAALIPGSKVTDRPGFECGAVVLDVHAFAVADEKRTGCLQHCWKVTSDTIAARVALAAEADELVLLKSRDLPGSWTWEDAAVHGFVDPAFPAAIRAAGNNLVTCAVNLRNWQPAAHRPELVAQAGEP
jgi:aspartokinase-like uncharacterized kinase